MMITRVLPVWFCFAAMAVLVVGCGRTGPQAVGEWPSEEAAAEPTDELATAEWKPAKAGPTADLLGERLAALAGIVSDSESLLEDRNLIKAMQRDKAAETKFAPATPVFERWEFQFAQRMTLDAYARLLDFFGIELGVLAPGGKATYVFLVSKAKPEISQGAVETDRRCYLIWRRGELPAADAALIERAGVKTGGRPVLHFLPPEVEAQLIDLEKRHAGEKASKIDKTRFGVRTKDDVFEWYVVEQSYRP